jgi:hypothetical protein
MLNTDTPDRPGASPKGKLMKRLILAFSALALLATAVPASARNCTTTCTPTFGGGQTCNTYCY